MISNKWYLWSNGIESDWNISSCIECHAFVVQFLMIWLISVNFLFSSNLFSNVLYNIFLQSRTMNNLKSRNNFLITLNTKNDKNSDISLKQHFTLMKIQLNSVVCFVSIWNSKKFRTITKWLFFSLLITEIRSL